MTVSIDELAVADPPNTWQDCGFHVDDALCRVGSVGIRLVGRDAGRGIVGWSLREVPAGLTELDGIATTASEHQARTPAEHENGVVSIDHVVLLSPNLPRTVTALTDLGVRARRERDGVMGGQPIRQVFFRLGEVILEVVGSPDAVSDDPSSLWGITYTVADIDAVATRFGDLTTPVKDAVQPGRRITTLRHRELGMSVRTAMISPHILDA